MTARRKLAPLSGVARSLPAAAVLVLAGLALVSLASSSRPTELETTPDSDGSLTSTTATTAPLPDTAEETPSSVPTTSSDQSETLPATSTPDDLQAEDAATTSTPDSATPTSDSPTSGSPTSSDSAVTASSTPDSTLTDDPDDTTSETDPDTTPTTESGQDSVTSSDSAAPTTDASADPAEGETDPDVSQADDGQADAAEQGGDDNQEEQTQEEQGEQEQGEQDETALADGQAPPEEERSLVQNALAMLIALLAVLGLLSLLVPPLWSLLQRFRDRDTDESLRRILWQWFRGLWSKNDDDVVDAVAAAPLINPIAMLDRLRTELESEPDPRSAVRKAYAAVESGFGDDEKARHTGETPTAYLERALGSIIEGENRPLAQLTYLFLLARYSQHDITEAMRSEAIDAVVELRSRYRQVEAVLV